ncbi:Pectate lyase-like protein 12 [Elsinoe fawcettii]|nr:Pectate lyase-like protein 12 [Elsinoe fawcettii]
MTLLYLAMVYAMLPAVFAQSKGTAYGFAAGTTGGNKAVPAVPADIAQLKSWLADNQPRVIMIDRTFNFTGSEGSRTEQGCRLKDSCTAANGGQDTIKSSGCDSNEKAQTVTYDLAGYLGMDVSSDKSIVGVGDKGVLLGKGLRLRGGAKNVIIQNIHITNLNPQYVWGGDAISLSGNDGVWIDHVKISKTGRQMFVSHYEGSRVTVSNTEFDGRTPFSHSCDGKHYWTMIVGGKADRITFDRNYIHDVSGRGPKIGSSSGEQIVQFVNNHFSDNNGHNFDISASGYVLAEGNYFQRSLRPFTPASSAAKVITLDNGQCSSVLGRACVGNTAVDKSGAIPSRKDQAVLDKFKSFKSQTIKPVAADQVASLVGSNFGPRKA